MLKHLVTVGFISTLSLTMTNVNQIKKNDELFITKQILQSNIDNFQQLTSDEFLTTDKSARFDNQELYIVNTTTHKKTDLKFKALSCSEWSIGGGRFIASDGNGHSNIYQTNGSEIIAKTPISFLKNTAILFSQKISDQVYIVSYPDENFHATSAIVDFSDINNLKYTLLPNNPFITNGNPAYIINNHCFIISVTGTHDWVSCDFSDFSNPIISPIFKSPSMIITAITNYSEQQLLVTINNISSPALTTQIWTINNKNPDLWERKTLNAAIIKNFIKIKPNLAIATLYDQSGLFLIDYSNWNELKISPIANSKGIDLMDYTQFPYSTLVKFDNQIIFNDYTSNQLKTLDFSDLNNISIKSLNLSLATYYSGLYQIVKINDQEFTLVDEKQNFDLITL